MCYFHAIGTLSSVDKLCGGWMSLRKTEAPKRPGETDARHVLFSSPSPSPHILRRRITASRAVWARSESGGAWDWVEGGSGGGGRSHGIGRVQRQTCWLITELLLSVHLDAELSGASGAETVKLSDAASRADRAYLWFQVQAFTKVTLIFFLLYPLFVSPQDVWFERQFGRNLSTTPPLSPGAHRVCNVSRSNRGLSGPQPWLSWWNTWWEGSWRTWQAASRRRNPRERKQKPPRREWLKRNLNNISNS